GQRCYRLQLRPARLHPNAARFCSRDHIRASPVRSKTSDAAGSKAWKKQAPATTVGKPQNFRRTASYLLLLQMCRLTWSLGLMLRAERGSATCIFACALVRGV